MKPQYLYSVEFEETVSSDSSGRYPGVYYHLLYVPSVDAYEAIKKIEQKYIVRNLISVARGATITHL